MIRSTKKVMSWRFAELGERVEKRVALELVERYDAGVELHSSVHGETWSWTGSKKSGGTQGYGDEPSNRALWIVA